MPCRQLARSCPLCASRQGTLIRSLRYALFDDLGLSGSSDLVGCAACGMVFNDLEAVESQLDIYYRSQAHYLASSTAGSGGYSAQEISRYQRLIAHLPAGGAARTILLDVGCGKGGLMRYVAEQELASPVGIEAAEPNRRFVQEELGLPVYPSLDAMPESQPAPTVIVLNHVLEHLADPLGMLRALVARARPETLFCLEVPDTLALLDRAPPWPDLYFEHINHFDAGSLRALARAAGLEILDEQDWPFLPQDPESTPCLHLLCRPVENMPALPLPSPNLARRLAERLGPGPLADSAMSALLAADRPLALWGLSQYAMLILGMYPLLQEKLDFLFDASPAKAGRRIAGLTVEPPAGLAALPADTVLLVPRSSHLPAQLAFLETLPFAGTLSIL